MPSNFTLPLVETKSVNSLAFPCPYCFSGGKDTARQLERHIQNICLSAPADILAKRSERKRKKAEQNVRSYLKKKAKLANLDNNEVNV